jgi:hypothetical protein
MHDQIERPAARESNGGEMARIASAETRGTSHLTACLRRQVEAEIV